MSVSRIVLLDFLNKLLKPEQIKDYCPNGLQVEGSGSISKIVTGVTASQALIDKAIAHKADAIFVHHGYFWKGENPCVTGMKRKRFASLLANNINLFAYHLPLDIHPELGNNAQLAKRLGIRHVEPLEAGNPTSVSMRGEFPHAISPEGLRELLQQQLGKKPLFEPANKQSIKTVAWCSGGGQGFIEQAASLEIDAFITGEVSEQTIHVAREMNIHFYAAGHHATERYGAKAVGEFIQKELGVEVLFVDIDNPA